MPVDARVVRGETLRPLRDGIAVEGMNFGQRVLSSGLILPGDDGVDRGLRPRWAQVMAIGPKQQDVVVGDWILVSHGRWTRRINYESDGEIKEVRMVDPKDVLGVTTQEEEPEDGYVANSITTNF